MRFKNFSTLDGLANNSIYDISKDPKGYIWFGTSDGLSRYDGYEFVNFKSDRNNIALLSTNILNVLEIDSSGLVWFGSSQAGLSAMNPYTGEFKSYHSREEMGQNISDNNVNAISHIGNKTIIGTNNGLNVLYRSENLIENYQLNAFGVDNNITSIQKENEKWIWLGTTQGASIVSIEKTKPIQPAAIENISSLLKGRISQIFKDEQVTTWLIGNNRIQRVEIVDHKIKILFELSAKELKLENSTLPRINCINQDVKGNYWLGTNKGIITFKLDGNDCKEINYIRHEAYNNESIPEDNITSICRDREGLMWIGTRYRGVSLFDPYKQAFKRFVRNQDNSSNMFSNNVRSVFQDFEDNIWIGYRNSGLDLYDSRTGTFTHFDSKDDNAILSNNIRGIFQDTDSVLWVGTQKGLNKVLKRKNEYMFTSYPKIGDLNIGSVYEFFKDSKGRFWLGTINGLVFFNPANDSVKVFRHNVNTNINTRRNFIRCIAEDNNGHLWLATDGGGLDEFIPETGEYINYISNIQKKGSLTHNKIYCLCFDKKNRLWIGTHGGLNVLKPGTNKFEVFTESEGLVNNVVFSIQEDDEKNLWISTSNGLSYLNSETMEFKNYLQDFEFSDDAWSKNYKGEMLIGGVNGFFHFNPKEIIENKVKPQVYLNGFKIQNEPIKSGDSINGRKLYTSSIADIKNLELLHHENFFTIDLIALSFSSANRIKYQYKLEGFDKEWNETDFKSRAAVYTNVPYGMYQFKYKAANADGIWSDEKTLKLVIHPAFYQTWQFKIAMILLLLFIVFVGYKLRLRSLTIQKRKLELEVEQKTRDLRKNKEDIEQKNRNLASKNKEIEIQRDKLVEMSRQIHEADERKIKFFTNISHEIRTPLTLISGPIEKLLDVLDQKDANFSTIKLVERNTNRLLSLVNQLLDFRKMDTGHMPINLREANFLDFVRDIFLSFEVAAEKKKIKLSLHHDSGPYTISYDSDVLEKIIANLLSNAIKYTQLEGNVSLDLKREQEQVVLSVKDNGPGILLGVRESIFKRFFRLEDNNQKEIRGSGIGLALAKDLAVLHGGDIEIIDMEERGSCFQLTIPIFQKSEVAYCGEMDKSNLKLPVSELKEISDNYSVLIIEDNQDLRSFIKDSLNCKEIIEAQNGEEGVKLALEKLPDLIISDVLMPGKNGFELCKLLKEDARTNHIPILLLTALGAEEHQEIGISLGAEDYIVKPFNHRILSGKVNNILQNRENFKEKLSQKLSNSDLSSMNWKEELPPFVIQIIKHIEENLQNKKFGVEELCVAMGMSHSTLYRKMKAITNKSSVEFIREVKIRKALELLKTDSQMQIAEAAFQVGFEDVNYFRQCFKKQFGKTPSELTR